MMKVTSISALGRMASGRLITFHFTKNARRNEMKQIAKASIHRVYRAARIMVVVSQL